MKTVFDRNGAMVRTLADGDNYVAKDGETLRVTLNLMDAAPPQVDALNKQWLAHKQRLSDAWKYPHKFANPLQQQAAPITPVGDSQERYEERLRNAWKASA